MPLSPLPALNFDTNNPKHSLKEIISKMEKWLQENEGMNSAKRRVLEETIKYGHDYINGWFKNNSRAATCYNIFSYAHENDLMFLKHVEIQLEKINDYNSSLRDKVQPIATAYKKAAMRKYEQQIENIAVGATVSLFVSALYDSKAAALLPLSIGSYFLSSFLAECRLAKAYENYEARRLDPEQKMPALEDGFDDEINIISAFASQTRRRFITFFKPEQPRLVDANIQPALQGSQFRN